MPRFIEVHDEDLGEYLLINVEEILYIHPRGSTFSSIRLRGVEEEDVLVSESYETIKEMLEEITNEKTTP